MTDNLNSTNLISDGSKVFSEESIKFWDNIEIIEVNCDNNIVYRTIKLYYGDLIEEIEIKELYDNYNGKTYGTDYISKCLYYSLFDFNQVGKCNYIKEKKLGDKLIFIDGISTQICILIGDNYQHSLLIYKKIQEDNFKLIKSYKMSSSDINNLTDIYLNFYN